MPIVPLCGRLSSLMAAVLLQGALTSARSAATSIYCPPLLQAQIDTMAGTLCAEEGDFKTSYALLRSRTCAVGHHGNFHSDSTSRALCQPWRTEGLTSFVRFSYFFEAFEGYNTINDPVRAVKCLKYMLMAKIMTKTPEVNPALLSELAWGVYMCPTLFCICLCMYIVCVCVCVCVSVCVCVYVCMYVCVCVYVWLWSPRAFSPPLSSLFNRPRVWSGCTGHHQG
jgi:hypothetical protein